MRKKRVFVSFDFDSDRALKDFIVGQAAHPDSPFEIVDTSLKEAAPQRTWEEKALSAIKRSDLMIVMVGATTHRMPDVLKESKRPSLSTSQLHRSSDIGARRRHRFRMRESSTDGIGRILRNCFANYLFSVSARVCRSPLTS